MINKQPLSKLFSKTYLYIIIILIALFTVLFGSHYFKQIVLGVIISMMLGISWDILARTGQASFGQSTYFGLGVYCTAIFAPILGVVLGWIVAILFSMIIAAFFGVLLSKLKGRYFAVSTMAVSMSMQVIALIIPATGGAAGITTTVLFRTNRNAQVIFASILLVIAVVISDLLLRSRPRTAAFLIRSNPYLAESSGVPVFRRKIEYFAISGGVAALAGALYSSMYGFVLPEDVFTAKYNLLAISVSILGGVDSSLGPLFGSILIKGMEELTKRVVGSTGYQLFVGLMIIVCVVVMPTGIVGALKLLKAKIQKKFLGKIKSSTVEGGSNE